MSCIIIFTACFISCLISDHQEAGWDSKGNGTLAYLCWQRVWSGAHKCADSPGRSRTGHDGRWSGEKIPAGWCGCTCCVVCGLWVLYRGGRDQAENQIQGLARSHDTLGHLAFYAQDCLGLYNWCPSVVPIFMSRLSACIFEWDAADVSMLRKAKRELLLSQGWPALTDEDVNKHLTREELALHCRRRTCGEETTILLLEPVLTELLSSKGNDSLGVPLLDRERMEHIWSVQKKHIKCIQDPPGVALYTETGSITKGGVLLKTYRCARVSTSLESFNLHLNRFIPGTSLSHTLHICKERTLLSGFVCLFNTP